MPPNRGGLQSNPIAALKRREQGHQLNLDDAATLASWPTASARDWKNGKSNQHGKNARPLNEVEMLASWATPGAKDGDKSVRTPKGAAKEAERKGWQNDLCTNAMATLGPTSNGSPASTESGGRLNPAFSLWLMGFPSSWVAAAPSKEKAASECSGLPGTPSFRKFLPSS